MKLWATAGVLSALAVLPAGARDLSFEDRVRHQRAIEEVYWSHRLWPQENPGPKPPLSAVMPEEAIRARVEDYLKKSAALEEVWQRRVTGEQLQAELDRMTRETRSPSTLKDLFRALGDDPFVIAETLARPTLVDRLARDWYARDERFHGAIKRRAEGARAEVRTVAQMRTMGGEYREVVEADRAALDRRHPIGDVEETDEGFHVVGVLSDGKLAVVTFAKTPFETWWSRARDKLGAAAVTTTDRYEVASTTGEAECVEDTWKPMLTVQTPTERVWHTAVWTGSEMIVWGGQAGFPSALPSSYAARYIPAIDAWAPMARFNAPVARLAHTAVWTGTEMIVWGGAPTGSRRTATGSLELPLPETLDTGGRYNPASQTWTATPTSGAPTARQAHTAVWTGSVMVVWGGFGAAWFDGGGSTGAIYDPSTDSWTPTSSVGAPPARYLHTAVWTGSRMIVWGGTAGSSISLNSGARFDPTTNTWSAMSAAGIPSARWEHTAVWDGDGMIVWGGANGSGAVNTGGRYVPATDTWTATSTTAGVPTPRTNQSAVWTGTRMLVWGGSPMGGFGVNTGSAYDPATQAWTPLATLNAPSARFSASAVWTGTEMIVWGGQAQAGNIGFRTGGRYDPASDTWIPTRSGGGPASPRFNHGSVWTGSEMIVWGGWPSTFVNTCGRYVPATGSWTFPASAPDNARQAPTAVWTGTEMIVWGGAPTSGNPVATGNRYNPTTDLWSGVTDVNAPSLRADHTAVWTGNVMVVWGGRNPNTQVATNTGGRYDPVTDSWAATSGTGAPTSRVAHRAVWTGSSMVVWGGTEGGPTGLDTGGRYDPVGDTWTPTSLGPGFPVARYAHVSVWTGSRMVVFGGGGAGVGSTGALYDPVADTWSAMSAGPSERRWAAAVWTGSEMVVWGGRDSADVPLRTGGRYEPVSDTWTPTSTGTGVPIGRYAHTSVWTGAEVVVWGGNEVVAAESSLSNSGMSSGGLYCVHGCAAAPGQATIIASSRISASVSRHAWDPTPGASGYDVVRGAIGTWPVGSSPGSESCAANDTSATFSDDADLPSAGQGFWYLVRAVNGCGAGTLGFEMENGEPATERISAACP